MIGTGKTTVARLFAQILEMNKLRAGHKVIEMTASDALRKGVNQFSTELAVLTGGDKSISPPVVNGKLRKGMNVEIKYTDKWYPGKVSRIYVEKKPLPVTDPALPPKFEDITKYDIVYPDSTEDIGLTLINSDNEIVLRAIDSATASGGVLFLDEAYDLDPASNRDGRSIIADIMKVSENFRDKVTIILAGYKTDIEIKLYSYNIGIRDRFRIVNFEDFEEEELQDVWEGLVKNNGWTSQVMPGAIKVSIVAARRLTQGRSIKGFANARSVRVLFNQSMERAKRRPNHSKQIIVEDVIGLCPTPENMPLLAAALKELDNQIGIPSVKEAVRNLCDIARRNYEKELNGMKIDRIPLNRLFLGNPGTGKTTVATIYATILKHLQLLSKGEVIERKASDFIGAVVGGSQEKTKSILLLAKGSVLIIDEAYNLNDAHYGKDALNTIVEIVNNSSTDDISVILLGYEKNMLQMLNDQNSGLRSRFDPAYAFHFNDFTDFELLEIFSKECVNKQINVPFNVRKTAIKHVAKERSMKNFGNARSTLSLLVAAQTRMNARTQASHDSNHAMIEADVLGENAALKLNPLKAIEKLEGGLEEYGFRTVMTQLGDSINMCRLENRKIDPIGNFIFTGTPGTYLSLRFLK